MCGVSLVRGRGGARRLIPHSSRWCSAQQWSLHGFTYATLPQVTDTYTPTVSLQCAGRLPSLFFASGVLHL